MTTLLKVADVKPNRKAIGRLPASGRPKLLDSIGVQAVDHRVFIRIPLERDEEIYGLGLNFKTLNQRGRILRLHTDHYGGRDNGRTHAPVPFYVSSRGYGLLVNSARYIDVWVGTAVRRDSTHPPVERDRNTDPDWSAQPYSDGIEMALDFEGIPPSRAAGLDENQVIDRKDEYMVGPSLLVAPLFAGQESRTVVLPPGKWFDFFTGEYAGEDETIEVTPGLDKIPVFARDGALIPMIEAFSRVPAPGEKPTVTWKKFGDKPGSFMLYDDDGVSWAYERGEFERVEHDGGK